MSECLDGMLFVKIGLAIAEKARALRKAHMQVHGSEQLQAVNK